jgi:Uma2 family endonuclease
MSNTSWLTVSMPEGIEAMTIRPDIPHQRLTDEEFEQLCTQNPELRIEMTSEGELIIMSPASSKGGHLNFLLTGRFFAWAETDDTGVGFDSSAGFTLSNGAKRSPDVSWIRRELWEALSEEEKDEFAPVCPDFVVELRSKSDRLRMLQEKMEEYILNGAQLGWLIDPLEKKVHIYRPNRAVEILDKPKEVSGDHLLRGFILKLEGIID